MAEVWDDDAKTQMKLISDGGRCPGLGRGYKPLNNNNTNTNNNNDSYRVGIKPANINDAPLNNNGDGRKVGASGGWGSDDGGWGAIRGGCIDNNVGRGNSNDNKRDARDPNINGSRRNGNSDNVKRPHDRNVCRESYKHSGNGTESTNSSQGFTKKPNTDDDNDSQPSKNCLDRGRPNQGSRHGDEDISDKPAPVTYIPPEISEDDEEMFSGVAAGLNFSKYDSIKVIVSGDNPPDPIDDFARMGLRALTMDNIVKSGYTKPTPIQKHAIPMIKDARDLMACAQTGSGKTAAFMVPIINSLLESSSTLEFSEGRTACRPQCVIISPTRELAVQTWKQALKFSKDSFLKCVVIYGGVAIRYSSNLLANGCHILVATPGRLLDFLDKRKIVSLESVRYVVFDEADKMLDIGFLPAMKAVMEHKSMVEKKERQTLMFSATFGGVVQKVAREFLAPDYLFVAVGEIGGACTDVEQVIEEVEKKDKREKLLEIMELLREDQKSVSRTLIFVHMKKLADSLAAHLSSNKIPTTSIHGNRMQEQREEALRDFRTGKMRVLVATGVASRGLDIKGVTHVINYDLPKEIDEYVHRIGRTGRVGNRGKATSFFDVEKDTTIARDLVRVLKTAGQQVPDWLEKIGSGRSYRNQRRDTFGAKDTRKFGNDGSYEKPGDYPTLEGNVDPEEEW